jgi:hypothetical protein
MIKNGQHFEPAAKLYPRFYGPHKMEIIDQGMLVLGLVLEQA